MSLLERTKGMPYGGIPYEALLEKLEETKMPTINYEEDYNKYIRSEITDWSLDPVLFESDHVSRDSSISKTQLNIRYNGSRGSQEYPKHPEFFIGFMDQDNRSLDNNPRMCEYKKQINNRMGPIEVQMGVNNGDHVAERPWSNASLNDCMRDIQTSMKTNTRVFHNELDGMAPNQNIKNIYDNKTHPLIYKNQLPDTLDIKNNKNSTQNNQYTFNSTALVSHDAPYSLSRTNYIPSVNTIVSANTNQLTNICDDRKILELISNNEPSHLKITPVNNHKLMEFDGKIITLIIEIGNNNKKINNLSLQNNNLSDNSLTIHNIVDNKILHTNKNIILSENNKNNSLFTIPFYIFQDIDTNVKKQNNLHLQNSAVNIINNINFNNQIENHPISNKYIFSDDIDFKIHLTNVDIIDETKETFHYKGKINNMEQKINSSHNEIFWKNSEESIVPKSQKQIRTSTTDDQIVIDIPKNNDKNIYISSKILGKKTLRGDHVHDHDSNIYNLLE